MLATKTTAPTQRTSWSAIALQIIAIMFVMTAMVGNWLHQLKVPRPDAYVHTPILALDAVTGKWEVPSYSFSNVSWPILACSECSNAAAGTL